MLEVFRVSSLPRDWMQEPPPPSLQKLGGDWIRSGKSVILAVPSAIIPAEKNYLINPRHPNFTKLKIEAPTDFAFDQQLFICR